MKNYLLAAMLVAVGMTAAAGVSVSAAEGDEEKEGRHRGGHHIKGAAELLNTTPEELRERVENGENFKDILEAAGVTKDDLKALHEEKRAERKAERQETLADILDISVADLEEYREDGLRLPEIIEDLGLDEDTVKEALRDAHIARINEKVSDGEITQEKADEIIERIENGERPFGGKGHGEGKRGFGGDQSTS